ncbi:MAG TPA: HlyD family efflux transporter periplasmic adaptor subunit [Candidatus Dormibacteraeota bacterium]|nr:HlyD family efflux transporter periplasmic adaptor subunit [Candidatus Dormibacteraeota bacterium]
MNRSRLAVAGLAAVALVLSALIYRDVFVPARSTGSTLNLYTVSRRTVTSSVTGTGSIVPMAQANVNFRVSGVLTEIDTTVGGHVAAGQVLAKVDSTSEGQALAAAQANLQVAQANLQAVETPLTSAQISQLEHNLAIAQQSYNDTVAQVNFTNTQDTAQVAADRNQLTTDQNSLTFNPTYQTDQQKLTTDQATLNADIATFNANCSGQTYPYSGACATYYATVGADQATVNNDQLALNTCCTAAITAVNADKSRLNQDLAKQQADTMSGQRSINSAASQVTSAQDQLNTQTQTKPNQIASAQAQLASAQAAVQTAQQNLAATTLVAPMNGTVNAINGVVGESVGPGSGSTPEAPGTQAPLPSTGTSSSFMVIGNDSGMEVVVPFAESDAARVAGNQDASVTFDAVPNVTITGKVIAVASSATVTSGVVNYYATISLDQGNASLKEGMTSNATVVVSSATNVLTVPDLAITRLGGQAYVNVYANGKEVRTPIETGVVGDTYTEVTSGLTEGEQIVIPSLRVPSGTTTRGTGSGIRLGGGG